MADTDRAAEYLDRRASLATPLGRHARMLEIRLMEDRIRELFAEGLVAGTTHTCQGQEAVSVGIAAVLRPTDPVSCTYRGHGHALAAGMTVEAVVGEILGRVTGCVGGLGGSMHLNARSVGLSPTTAIVGAGIPIAAGFGYAAQVAGRDDVAVALFGDGASNIGAFHEGLNLAAVWRLPVVFVCENNLYGEYSPVAATTAVTDIADRAAAYRIPGATVDGQSLEDVMAAMTEAVDRARNGGGPTLLEMKTYRYAGHSRSDPASYRPAGELAAWQQRDPIRLHADRLIEAGTTDAGQLDLLTAELAERVTAGIERAKASPAPPFTALHRHIRAAAKEAS